MTTIGFIGSGHIGSTVAKLAVDQGYDVVLASQGQPAGTSDRRALTVFGDDAAAKTTVTSLLDEFGYDTVDGGSLSESWRIEPGTPAYGPRLTKAELTTALAQAQR